jgi:hypothetical protein
MLLVSGMGMVILGSYRACVDLLGEAVLLGCGTGLLLVASAMLAGITVLERAVGSAAKFITWLRG